MHCQGLKKPLVAVIFGLLGTGLANAESSGDAWQNYQVRKQVINALNLTGRVKTALAVYYAENGEWAADHASYGLPSPEAISSDEVAAVRAGPEGKVTIQFSDGAHPALRGRDLTIAAEPSDGKVRWVCRGEASAIPPKYLPAHCN